MLVAPGRLMGRIFRAALSLVIATRVTEAGDRRVTESGDVRVSEGSV
jgi:hypothetical protein